MKPNLFIVGAPKCGTSAWVEYLGSHPDIFFSPAKEPHHFSHDFPDWCWARTREEYLALFAGSGDAPVVGEASVRYLYSKVAATEIHRFNPDSKILVFLRDQEDFLPSLHNQQLYNRDESIEDFERAWLLSGKRTKDTISASCREPRFLDYEAMGRFQEQVERYFALFPADQVRVLHYRDWVASPREAYLGILEFLGLTDDGRTEFPPVHQARHHRSRLLATLTQNPPAWALRASAVAKWLLGKSQLGLAARLRRINRAEGYRATISPALKQEIRRHYQAENRLLDHRIWRPVRKA